ncbi:MAG: cellulase family glycosylhydrolase [Bacteroidetes bacterium]|nr:cellulase family glycosylhydrolase [Bacteroidota bacterium]
MKTNRTLYRVFILATFVGVLALTIFGISQLLAFLNSGADRSSIFHKDLARATYYIPSLTWIDINNPGRPIETETLAKVERDYMDAIYFQCIALKSLNTDGINDVFTEKAKKNVLDIIAANMETNTTIEKTTLSHNLFLNFYSADGQLIVLTDKDVVSYSRVFVNGKFLFDSSETSDYKIVLLLEDGFWKIRHLEKISTQKTAKIINPTKELTHNIAGINYYPKDAPWDTFGATFSKEIINQDFTIIRDLGLNTVRVFIGYEDFGKATVSEEKLNKLTELLNLAELNNLKVILTLFDFYGDYSVLDWSQTQQHATLITKEVKDHKALLAWDVKNEANLDYESRGESLVKAWLSQMIHTIKKEDSIHPITVGWSNGNAALDLVDQVDFVSFHFYDDLEHLPALVTSLKSSTEKTIVLEEFGMSNYNGIWNPFGYSENDQKEYYDAFFESQKRDSLHYLSWTLYDFSDIPNQVAGRYPWRKNKQKSFGILNISGAKKSAFNSVKNR